MDIYTRKSNLKLVLLIIGVIIGIATVAYTNHLAGKMAREEKYKARLWAEAIGRKAKLVRYTKELFAQLAKDERTKVNVYAQSTKFILQVNDNDLLTFFNEVITSNNDIAAILCDNNGAILGARNITIPDSIKWFKDLPNELRSDFQRYAPILVDYKFSVNRIYYRDSNLFTKLKQTLSDLIETFISEVVVNSVSAPVILTDEKMNLLDYGNIDSTLMTNDASVLKLIKKMQATHEPVVADLGEGVKRYIYYDDSPTLKQLRIFPYVQLTIFGVFLIISYLAFSNARRSEQNLVWVGMAKETAHQLGTPISSIEGWIAYLRDLDGMKGNEHIIDELQNDVNRLALVSERFSKIGSVPKLTALNLTQVLEKNVTYMQRRSSAKVKFEIHKAGDFTVQANEQLFDWVLENLMKNAIDAMDGEGEIDIQVSEDSGHVLIDVIDTGKGIAKGRFETIFEPGFSTKRRGWGLGLSLTKRIVEEYHNGKIYVKHSELGKGTTIRIMLPKHS